MFNPQKIRELINERKLSEKKFSMKDFCLAIGLTNAALMGILDRGAMPKVNTLETIANYFGVDMNYFFDNYQKSNKGASSIKLNLKDTPKYILERYEELVSENTRLKDRIKFLEHNQKSKTD